MSSQVYRFERSENETLEALQDILHRDRKSPIEEWSVRAELVMEPVGWDALWRLPKEACKSYGVRFPCVVYVTVEGMDYSELSASLFIVAVQDDNVRLPERVHNVPLIQLWPTIAQPNSALDVKTTAEFIDLLRFFYTYLWLPWDEEEVGWGAGGILEARVTLWAAACNGKLPRLLVRRIASLRSDAAEIFNKIAAAEADLPSLDDDNCDDSLISAKSLSLLAELHARLEQQRARWAVLENPALRNALALEEPPTRNDETTIIWSGGAVSQLVHMSKQCQKLLGANSKVSVAGNLADALKEEACDLFILEGSHEVPHGPLPVITMAGTGGAILKASEPGASLLNITEGALVKALRLSAADVSTVLLVQSGGVEVIDCEIFDNTTTPLSERSSQGCVVFAGGSVRMLRCCINSFYTGITVHAGASVELIDCEISNCGVAIQLHEGSSLTVNGTSILKCLECGVRYESSTANKTILGGVNLLNDLENVSAMECTFTSNSGGDVCIVGGQPTILPGAGGWRDLC